MEEKIAFYCRVSTEKQKDENTIDKQLYNLGNIYRGRNVVDKYLDDGFSGSFEGRPELLRMKEDAKLGVFNVLGIDVIDRSTRGGAVALEPLFDYLIRCGIKIEIAGIPVDYKSPQGKFGYNVQAEAVRLAKEIIVRNMISGKYAKADKGILIGCYPSWGFKLIKRNREEGIEAHFEVDKSEAWKIRKCFEVYSELQNLNQGVKKLAEMGIYARGKKGEEGKYKIPILPGTLKQILQNETYIGNFYFGKKLYCEATRIVKEVSKTRDRGLHTGWRWRSKSEWKLIKVPPIVDKALFDRVQGLIKMRSKNCLRQPKYEYLLQKLIVCIHCGRPYRGKPCAMPFKKKDGDTSRYFRYICYSRHEYKPCPSTGANLRILENTVWTVVKAFISNPENVRKAIAEFERAKDKDKAVNQKTLDVLLSEREALRKKKSNFLDLFGDDRFNKQDLYAKIEPLGAQETLLNKQIDELTNKIRLIDETGQINKEIQKACASYYSKVKNPTFELKKRIVRDWVKEINIMDDGAVKIKMRVPEVAGSILKNSDNVYKLLSLSTGYDLIKSLYEFEHLVRV